MFSLIFHYFLIGIYKSINHFFSWISIRFGFRDVKNLKPNISFNLAYLMNNRLQIHIIGN